MDKISTHREPPAAAQPATERLLELARCQARDVHMSLAAANEFLTDAGVHVFSGTLANSFGFSVCPHPDCVLVRAVAPAAALSSQEGCTECVAKDFRIATMQDSIDGCARRVQELSKRLAEKPDVVCMHGTAMDVHCCNCHSGFIFDAHHVCAPAAALSPTKLEAIRARQKAREKVKHLHGNLCLSSLEGQEASDDCTALLASAALSPSEEPNKELIHMADYGGQPDIRIKCTQVFTQPAWGNAAIITRNDSTGEGGVYKADNGAIYTFTESSVTCPECKAEASAPLSPAAQEKKDATGMSVETSVDSGNAGEASQREPSLAADSGRREGPRGAAKGNRAVDAGESGTLSLSLSPAPAPLKELIAEWREHYGWDNSSQSAFKQAANELERAVSALSQTSEPTYMEMQQALVTLGIYVAFGKTSDGLWKAYHAPSVGPAIGSPQPPTSEEHFWDAVANGWDIEPREYFEREAVAMGFKSPVEMAVHHMWKRHAKVWPNEELRTLGSPQPPSEARKEE